MRDRTAGAVLLVLAVAALAGWGSLTADLDAGAAANATFTVEGDAADGELVVAHDGGEPLASGSVRVLVYEERPLLPDRTVHGSTWEADGGVGPGDRLVLEDRRFASGQRLVVRWYGEAGQANHHEARL